MKRIVGSRPDLRLLEFTTGDQDYEHKSSDMLNQELAFYSLAPHLYEKYLKENGFKILLCESDQEHHLVWIAQYEGCEQAKILLK